ncbi:MAG: hypothetical protein Q9162_005271 [Coniocarpon cinnabarinum]
MGSCCLSGHIHDGKPVGREEQHGGIDVYVSEPPNGSKAKTVIILCDIFGWKLTNTRLLADQYAKAGFYVYLPDLHEGDSIDFDFLQSAEPPLKVREQQSVVDKTAAGAKVAATLPPWLLKHPESKSLPIIDGFINTVKYIPGTNKIGTLGFCWGGRYAILSAHGKVDAAVAFHPSLVSVPNDLQDVSRPLSIGHGDKDSLTSNSDAEKMKEVLDSKKNVPSQFEIYHDQVHGFALRGDFSSEKDKQAMDTAEKQGQDWFHKYLAE